MKKKLIAGICLGMVAGFSGVIAAEGVKNNPGAVLSNSSAGTHEKVEAIQSYVGEVEKSLSSYTRKEEALSADQMKAVTDESWKKIHGYFDGDTLRRMKLYPVAGSEKTEEFYFFENKPVFVFVEEKGSDKDGHDTNAAGSKYYFADDKLIAAMTPDGKQMDLASADAEKMGTKLQKESKAFQSILK